MKRWTALLFWALWSSAQGQNDACPISFNPLDFNGTLSLALFYVGQPECYTEEMEHYSTLTEQITRRFFTSEQLADVGTAATSAANLLLNDFNQRIDVSNLQAPILSFARSLTGELEAARTRFDAQSWSVTPWMLATNDPTTVWMKLQSALEEGPDNCGMALVGASAACDQRFVQVLMIAPYIVVMHDLVESATKEIRTDFNRFASTNLTEWNAYFSNTQFHYPWELLLNRWTYEWLNKDQEDEHNNVIGFRRAPNFKLNLLHPDVGYSYISDQQSGLRHEAAIMFEWIGFQVWRKDYNVRLLKPIGVGLVSTHIDVPNLDRSGYGLVFHYGKFGLAWSKHNNYDVWTINVDLLRLLEDSDSNLAESLKRRRTQQ